MSQSGRVESLEIALAHQTRTVEEMSEELRRQGGVIDRLEARLAALTERFLALEEVATPRPEVTPPPHY